MKNSFFHFAAFFILSMFMVNCQKTATPPQEEEEEIIDAVFMALDEDAPSFECTNDSQEVINTFYNDEITNSICRLNFQLIDSTAKSKRGIGMIIKNKAVFEKYFTCRESSPPIDFDNYFVLAGYYGYTSPPKLKEKKIILCGNKLVFKMDLEAGIAAQPGSIFIMIAIERKYINKEILIDMRITN